MKKLTTILIVLLAGSASINLYYYFTYSGKKSKDLQPLEVDEKCLGGTEISMADAKKYVYEYKRTHSGSSFEFVLNEHTIDRIYSNMKIKKQNCVLFDLATYENTERGYFETNVIVRGYTLDLTKVPLPDCSEENSFIYRAIALCPKVCDAW